MEFLTVQEAADILKVPYCQTYNLVRSGCLGAFRIGKHWRIPKDGLLAWVNQQIKAEQDFSY